MHFAASDMRSMAMVDRSGWDQSFIDVGSAGGGQLTSPSASNGGTVMNGRRTVDCASDMDSDGLKNGDVNGVGSTCDLIRLHDLMRGLRISELRQAAADSESTSRASTDRVDVRRASPSIAAASVRSSHRVLPVEMDPTNSADATPTNGGYGDCMSPSCGSDSGTSGGRVVTSSGFPFDVVADLMMSPTGGPCAAANAFFDDGFPTYENTTRTMLPIDGRLSAVCPTTTTTTLPADASSPFDSTVWHGFGWTTSDFAGGPRIARHSSSASDFVGSSTTGSPPPFATSSASGGIDVCCRSSSSPFRGGSGSQSDSGCSDGGGDSSDHASSSALHFRFPVGPSPIVDDCPSAVAAISRCRDGLVVQPSAVRCVHNNAADVTSPAATTTTPTCRSTTPSTYSRVVGFLPAWDVERLETVYSRLKFSGFYYGRMSIDEATERLRRTPVGTFLLRDSADERYRFSISVQTCRGTTSIRVAFRSGLFRLDCSADQEHMMPTFDCVIRLIGYYVGLCRGSGSTGSRNPSSSSSAAAATAASTVAAPPSGNSYVLLETSGRRDTPVLLRTPLKDRVSPLAHLSRRTIHAALNRGVGASSGSGLSSSDVERSTLVDRLQLVPSLKRYLKDYPYDL